MQESELLRNVIQLAGLRKWRTAHFRTAVSMSGNYMTPVAGRAKGFPDLVMVKGPRIIFAELKSKKGRLSPEQVQWLTVLDELPGAEVYIWRPVEWMNGTIDRVLKGEF